jgi:hypothetical protein
MTLVSILLQQLKVSIKSRCCCPLLNWTQRCLRHSCSTLPIVETVPDDNSVLAGDAVCSSTSVVETVPDDNSVLAGDAVCSTSVVAVPIPYLTTILCSLATLYANLWIPVIHAFLDFNFQDSVE